MHLLGTPLFLVAVQRHRHQPRHIGGRLVWPDRAGGAQGELDADRSRQRLEHHPAHPRPAPTVVRQDLETRRDRTGEMIQNMVSGAASHRFARHSSHRGQRVSLRMKSPNRIMPRYGKSGDCRSRNDTASLPRSASQESRRLESRETCRSAGLPNKSTTLATLRI
jgi:hypothetical protein